jgi:type II secretory pathway component PulM
MASFLLTVIFFYAEPDRPPQVRREQIGSYIECERARAEAVSKAPSDVKTVTATCTSGSLPKGWVNR